MTSYTPIYSKIELNGVTNQGNKQSRNRVTKSESPTDDEGAWKLRGIGRIKEISF